MPYSARRAFLRREMGLNNMYAVSRGIGLSVALAVLLIGACAYDIDEEPRETDTTDEEVIERDLIDNSPRD